MPFVPLMHWATKLKQRSYKNGFLGNNQTRFSYRVNFHIKVLINGDEVEKCLDSFAAVKFKNYGTKVPGEYTLKRDVKLNFLLMLSFFTDVLCQSFSVKVDETQFKTGSLSTCFITCAFNYNLNINYLQRYENKVILWS